jgi:hypothetical protein
MGMLLKRINEVFNHTRSGQKKYLSLHTDAIEEPLDRLDREDRGRRIVREHRAILGR